LKSYLKSVGYRGTQVKELSSNFGNISAVMKPAVVLTLAACASLEGCSGRPIPRVSNLSLLDFWELYADTQTPVRVL